jgi:hypothetical protein
MNEGVMIKTSAVSELDGALVHSLGVSDCNVNRTGSSTVDVEACRSRIPAPPGFPREVLE